MRKLAITGALALAAILAVAGTASARYNATVANGGAISAVSSGEVTFTASSIDIECALTLRGDLGTSVSNVLSASEQNMGNIDSVNWNNCDGGDVRQTLGTPWNLNYKGVEGTLPNEVTAVRFAVDNAEFQLATFFNLVNCLYRGDANATMAVASTRTANVDTSSTISVSGPE